MAIDWRANLNIILTGLVSAICWIGFVLSVTYAQNQSFGAIFMIIAVISLLRFGQLLDKNLSDVL